MAECCGGEGYLTATTPTGLGIWSVCEDPNCEMGNALRGLLTEAEHRGRIAGLREAAEWCRNERIVRKSYLDDHEVTWNQACDECIKELTARADDLEKE